MAEDVKTTELIEEFFKIERRKSDLQAATKAQIDDLNAEQKPIKSALRCRNKQQVLLYKMILDNNDVELIPEEFADIMTFWADVAIKAGVDAKCAKNFNCPNIFTRSIVEQVEQQFNLTIM